MRGDSAPRRAMAFKFLEPMTAPGPQRPAWRPPSLAMLAYFTRFSPAGPMLATLMRLSPSRSLTARSVSVVLSPNKPLASRNWGLPSCTNSRVGESACPVTISASPQAFFNSVARKLEERESPMNPVRGDLVSTANLLEVVRRDPTRGLPTNISGLSGPRGSAPGGQYFQSR